MSRPLPRLAALAPLAVLVVLAVLAGALLVAACGTSPSPSTSPAPSSSSVPPPSPSNPASPTAEPTPSPAPTASPAQTPASGASPAYESPTDLAVGDCYDPIEDTDDGLLLAALIRPCAGPHLAEVFGAVDHPEPPTAPFPGESAVVDAAIEACDAAFEAYVGIPFNDSELSYLYFNPTESTWAGGDRLILCVIDDDGAPITGSLRDSRR